jgi:membrane-bound serine protease (ClpP class)
METLPRAGTSILPCLTLIALTLLLCPSVFAAEIHLCPYEGPITPVAAEFLAESIEDAADAGAEAVIIQLDTPGGLDTSMRRIIKAQLASPVPVVVFVGPGGSRAASAGAFITLAAHVAVMAPGTNIGSASPVQMGGAGMDSTMASKVSHDAAAYIASLASRRGRDQDLARKMVDEALNLTAEEALEAGLIDFMAPVVSVVIDSLRGRAVDMDGAQVQLADETAVLVTHEMSSRQKFLKQLADPNLAYILMLLGIYGLFFELSNPGALVPGILGGICLLLALFAFQALPVDYTGVGLILLGVIMLILEIKVPSYGSLSIGGLVALVLGSLMLFDSTEEWARLSLRVVIPSVLVFAGFFLICVWLVIRGQKRRVTTGLEALVGETGRVLQAVGPRQPGKVVCHGEIWDAACDTELEPEATVVVVQVAGRVLTVAPHTAARPEQRS